MIYLLFYLFIYIITKYKREVIGDQMRSWLGTIASKINVTPPKVPKNCS